MPAQKQKQRSGTAERTFQRAGKAVMMPQGEADGKSDDEAGKKSEDMGRIVHILSFRAEHGQKCHARRDGKDQTPESAHGRADDDIGTEQAHDAEHGGGESETGVSGITVEYVHGIAEHPGDKRCRERKSESDALGKQNEKGRAEKDVAEEVERVGVQREGRYWGNSRDESL